MSVRYCESEAFHRPGFKVIPYFVFVHENINDFLERSPYKSDRLRGSRSKHNIMCEHGAGTHGVHE